MCPPVPRLRLITDRHLLIALLVAPLLAVLAWFATDALISEKAKPAQAGEDYRLLPKSNCRYASGVCDLVNEDMHLELSVSSGSSTRLELRASHGLSMAVISIGGTDSGAEPMPMRQLDYDGLRRIMPVTVNSSDTELLRLVVVAGQSRYYAQTSVGFIGGR